MRPFLAAIANISLFAVASYSTLLSAEASFEGPESVPVFHPLCFKPLKEEQGNGGAFSMDWCSAQQQDVEVKKMPDGSYFAKRPNNELGEGQGFVVYQPIGTLDDAMELLLVHDKASSSDIETAIYVIGRLPGFPSGTRDFITSIEEEGKRCNGGIKTARLVSAAILEVDINMNPALLMSLEDGSGSERVASIDSLSSLSLKPTGTLDNRETSCIGTITKTYDLLENKQSYAWISFIKDTTRVAVDPYQQCFDQLVIEFIEPPKTISMQDFTLFTRALHGKCGK